MVKTTIKDLEIRYTRFKRDVALIFMYGQIGLICFSLGIFIPNQLFKMAFFAVAVLFLGFSSGKQMVMAARIIGESDK